MATCRVVIMTLDAFRGLTQLIGQRCLQLQTASRLSRVKYELREILALGFTINLSKRSGIGCFPLRRYLECSYFRILCITYKNADILRTSEQNWMFWIRQLGNDQCGWHLVDSLDVSCKFLTLIRICGVRTDPRTLWPLFQLLLAEPWNPCFTESFEALLLSQICWTPDIRKCEFFCKSVWGLKCPA